METYCAKGTPSSKFRPNFTNDFYHNLPSYNRNLRSYGSEYALPNCNSRRSPPSIAHNQNSWQDRIPRGPRSFNDQKPSNRGKFCSIALAIASFVVLVVVLAIAGLALYMGALHTETTSGVLNFSCSAKVLRGDRFIGALQEKARRYKRQLEALYQRSVLGSALISCSVDKFGNDTFTVHAPEVLLQLTKKLVLMEEGHLMVHLICTMPINIFLNSRTFSNIEKNIREILISDAISKKPIFRNIRFDPRSITVKLHQDNDMNYYQNSPVVNPKEFVKQSTNKNGVVFKSHTNTTLTITTKKPIIKDELSDVKEENLPVIHGSFKISKTDADITEKKTEITTIKPKMQDKFTTASNLKTTFKESSITSALYKIAAVEKLPKVSTTTKKSISTKNTTPMVKINITTTEAPKLITTPINNSTTSPLFVINPHMFDQEPWIPIVPNQEPDEPAKNISEIVVPIPINKTPTYTSFTNPGLSFNFFNTEPLGSTSLKSHPIPVNKVPFSPTEPSVFTKVEEDIVESTTNLMETVSNADEASSLIKIETVNYNPSSNDDLKKEELLKNISSIFHTLASTIDTDKLDIPSDIFDNKNETTGEEVFGQGQVEVVEGDVEDLIKQTTKNPLVTLIPVKSNSGIGRPLRRRPGDTNNLSVENRSFPSFTKLNQASSDEELPKKHTDLDNFKIVGVLNFATENTNNDQNDQDIVRYPKMEPNQNSSEVIVFATNSSVSSSRNDNEKNVVLNILSPEKIKQLSEISKVNNYTGYEDEPIISNKAISSSYTINHSGFKILTKTFTKINSNKNTLVAKDDNKSINSYSNNNNSLPQDLPSDCGNYSIRCGDGKCLPETTKCNQLIDCNDGRDEQNCNCADYLRSQYLLRKICDGIVDCWDFSDENQCDWCTPGQHVCSNSKVCINKSKICDGVRDCPQGDDERQCVSIASNLRAVEEFPYYSEGYLMVRKFGHWGKLCIDNFDHVVSSSHISWEISDLGKAVCKSMTYQNMDSIKTTVEAEEVKQKSNYFELAYSFKNETKSSLSFKETTCPSKKVVKVKCQSLECGARPQAIKHIARVVGGGNAGLGSWPWQAALYKEGEFQCGATLLSDRWLVSAGHCFYHSQEEHWVARLGALRRGTALPSPYEQLRSIIRILVHPGYVDSGFINDISLLQMEFPVIFSDYVRPVCLPPSHHLPLDGTLCTVVGWGQLFEVGRIFPDTLQEVQVPVISTPECRKRTLFLPLYRITDDMFCAGYERGGRDACLGDSGGPLMCPEPNGRWTLHGITSNGYGCARANRPGVYTKVANYIEWIQSSMDDTEMVKANSSSIIKTVCTGHRCPLGECLPENRLCNGYIECSDGSDERNC